MQLNLTIDLTGASPDVVLGLIYACADNGSRFTFTGQGQKIMTTLDGSKLLTAPEFVAISGLPYVLTFAQPPVAPVSPTPTS